MILSICMILSIPVLSCVAFAALAILLGPPSTRRSSKNPTCRRRPSSARPTRAPSRLESRGLTLSLSETSEVLGNLTGGRRRTVVYGGLTRVGVQLDTGKALGVPGGTLKATGFQIHGRGLSANALGRNLHTISNLEVSNRGTLLGELW